MSATRLLAALVALGGAALLLFSLRALLRGLGGAAPLQKVLATLPAAARQRVELPAGPVVLSAEGRHFTTDFAGLRCALLDARGQPVPSRPVLFRFKRSGMATTRLEILRYDIPAAGPHVLEIAANGPIATDASSRFVFTRPVAVLRLIAIILGLVLGGGGLIAGAVLAIVD